MENTMQQLTATSHVTTLHCTYHAERCGNNQLAEDSSSVCRNVVGWFHGIVNKSVINVFMLIFWAKCAFRSF